MQFRSLVIKSPTLELNSKTSINLLCPRSHLLSPSSQKYLASLGIDNRSQSHLSSKYPHHQNALQTPPRHPLPPRGIRPRGRNSLTVSSSPNNTQPSIHHSHASEIRQSTIPNCGDPEFRRSLTSTSIPDTDNKRQVPACLDPEFRVRSAVESEERYIELEKRQDTIPNCGDPEFRRSMEKGKRQVPACLDPEFRV